MISQAAEYALRAVLCLAQRPGSALTTHIIAGQTHVPEGYLAKIMQALGRAQLVISQRGVNGGFVLGRSADDITLLDVVAAVDPSRRITTCPLGICEHAGNLCPLHRKLDEAAAGVEQVLRSTTLARLLTDPSALQANAYRGDTMIEMERAEIQALLEDVRIGRLCMASRDGRPYALPLPFCFYDGTIYLRLPLAGRKGEVLKENDRVCFEVDTFTDSFDAYASVLIEGRLVEVTDVEEKLRVKELNDRKYSRLRGGYRPGHGRVTPVSDLPMRKIAVENLSGRKKTPSPGGAGARDLAVA